MTFQFNHGPVTVEVADADSRESAIAAARCQEVGAPVPESISAEAVEIKHGGARTGSGNRKRKKLVKEARDIKKQIRWTATEWEKIKAAAAAAGMTDVEYQRSKILK